MQHYALFDANGLNPALYNDDIYPPDATGSRNAAIPAGAVILTDAQWSDLLANQGLRRWDGKIVVPYVPPPSPPPTPQVSAKQFAYALNHLDARTQWDQAYPGQKQDDRDWFTLGGDPFPIDHKRIVRMLAVAGLDAGKVTTQALTE